MSRLTFTAATAVKALHVDKQRKPLCGFLLCHQQKLGSLQENMTDLVCSVIRLLSEGRLGQHSNISH